MRPAGQLMTRDVITIGPDAPVLEMPLNRLPLYEYANISSGVAAFSPYLVKVKALLFLS